MCTYRVPVSMGAVGASAPMLFKVVGASTHTFLAIFPLIHLQRAKSKVKYSTFEQKMNPSTHAFKLLTGALFTPILGYILKRKNVRGK